MNAFCRLLVVALFLPCFTGCVAVSMHSTRPVQVRVTDRATGQPVADAKISVDYWYDSYGVFHVFRVPKPATAQTGGDGVAIIPLATFGYGINFVAAGKDFRVPPELIRHGGFPNGSYR